MDLLGQDEYNKKQEPKGKKMVLTLLIFSVILLIIVLALLLYISNTGGATEKQYSLLVNDKQMQITEGLLISDTEGNMYISLKDIAKNIGFTYQEGEYKIVKEDNTKCYLSNAVEVIQFETNSNKIYKTKIDNSITDHEYYTLTNKIINQNDKKYIALNDLEIALNIVYNYSDKSNQSTIYTGEKLVELYKSKITEETPYTDINIEYNNMKTFSYNMIVVANQGRYGVINGTDGTEIIPMNYLDIKFDENSNNFIVKNVNSKYGIINNTGKIIVDFKYDNLRIINYDPLLYEAKLNNKYGLIDKNSKLILTIEYDGFGYPGEVANNIEPLLIIPNVVNNEKGIIMIKDKKYGIVNLETGELLLQPTVDKIYCIEKDKQKYYVVQVNEQIIQVKDYINSVNAVVVDV